MNKVNHPINIHGGKIEHINKKNFAKLALYLWETDIPKEKFDMTYYGYDGEREISVNQVSECYNQCGACACALGHAILAGIEPKGSPSWLTYCDDNFVYSTRSMVWEFCFANIWPDCPKFAAMRIAYMLAKNCIIDNILFQSDEVYIKALERYFDKFHSFNWNEIREIANGE